MKKLILMSILVGIGAGLAPSGREGGGGKNVVTPPGSPADPNAKFGAKFAAAFKANPNSDPAVVSAGDVVPVDPTADPSPVR